MRIVRLANYVGPRSGGMRTALRELGAGYLAAGHDPVLIIPGRRRGDEATAQGRMITRYGPIVPFTGGYRALLGRRRLATLLTELRPDRLEVSDRTTLRWTGQWAREHGVPAVMVSHESLTGLFSLPADVSGMSRWRSRLLSERATALADTLNRRSSQNYHRVVCTTRWAAAEFERIGAPNLTFGLAALEALACGTPVVVSASSALPEVVAAAGIAVSGEDFAGGVQAILARDPTARRAAARARAEEFGWPASVTAFLAAHEALNTDSYRRLGQVQT